MPIILGRKSGGSGGGGAPSGPAGGDLTGTYPNPDIANLAIDTGMIANNAVTAAKVAADVATQAELDAVSALTYWDAIVRKTVDESVTSSTALQNDNELLFPILANTPYYYELLLVITSTAAAADCKTDFALSAGSATTAWRQLIGLGPTTQVIHNGQLGDISTTMIFATGTALTNVPANKIQGMIVGDTNANFGLRWAQNTSDLAAVTVKAGSTLAYRALV